MSADPQKEPSQNPFADDPVDVHEIDEANPYGAAIENIYKPVYERSLRPRTKTIMAMAVFGFASVVLNEFVLGTFLMVYFLPLAAISLIVSAIAMWLGLHDLSAMQAGVMHAERQRLIRTSVVIASFSFVLFVVRMIYLLFVMMNG